MSSAVERLREIHERRWDLDFSGNHHDVYYLTKPLVAALPELIAALEVFGRHLKCYNRNLGPKLREETKDALSALEAKLK